MLKYYFNDVEAIRFCITAFNSAIYKYGCINQFSVRELLEIGYECTNFIEAKIGWTDKFIEERDVKPMLINGKWSFCFILPDAKEL